MYYLIYCPEGSTSFDLQKATERKKSVALKVLDEYWMLVVVGSSGDE